MLVCEVLVVVIPECNSAYAFIPFLLSSFIGVCVVPLQERQGVELTQTACFRDAELAIVSVVAGKDGSTAISTSMDGMIR